MTANVTIRWMMIGLGVATVACKGDDGGIQGVPTVEDRDGDGLSNVEEASIGSNPDAADTDRDGWDDLVEVQSYTDPLNGFDHPYTGGWPIDACRNDIEGTGGAVGDVALAFSLMDQYGEPLRLHDFCNQKVVLVSSAMWCSECRFEAPMLARLFNDHRDEGLMIITLLGEDASSRNPSQQVLIDWADEFGIEHPVVQDTSFSATAVFTGSGGASLPVTQFVDRGSVVSGNNLRDVTEKDILDFLRSR